MINIKSAFSALFNGHPPMVAPMRIVLNENDFRQLVSGEVVKGKNYQIALRDIGYTKMYQILKDAYYKANNLPPVSEIKSKGNVE